MRLLIFLVLLVVLVPASTGAHDKFHPELNDWFNKLKSEQGLCCSDLDGTVLADKDWESVNDPKKPDVHFRVMIEDLWWDVPDAAIIKEPNRVGRTMVWPVYKRGFGTGGSLSISIRCFMLGAMG